jgi:hypothetical protein
VSSERFQVVRLLEATGESMSPAAIAAALGRPSGATRQLLSKMRRDGEVSTLGRGRYIATSGSDTDVTGNNANAADNAIDDTDKAKNRLSRPNTLRAFSLRDAGMVDYGVIRARKGYGD